MFLFLKDHPVCHSCAVVVDLSFPSRVDRTGVQGSLIGEIILCYVNLINSSFNPVFDFMTDKKSTSCQIITYVKY